MELRCPYCNSVITSAEYRQVIGKIRAEEKERIQTLRIKLETELKKHYEKHFSKQRKEIETAKKLLEEGKRKLAQDKKDIIQKERKIRESLESEIKLKYEQQFQQQQKTLRKRLDELQEMKSTLKRQELELRSSIKQELELKYENELEKERDKLARERKRLEDKEYQIKMEQEEVVSSYRKRQISLQKTIEKQTEVIEELKREADRRSLAELGDIPEEKLIDILKREFPEDLFERVGKGRAGGDAIQTLMFNNRPVGKLLYESKNEKSWKNAWINKIKEDRVSIGTPYAILVSKAFPRNTKHFAIVHGIPVVSPRLLPHLARIIRSSIIAIERQKLSAFEKEEKVGMLYSYLNSSEFKSSAIAIADSIGNLNKIRTDERNTHEKTWTKQEHEVNSISKNFNKIHSNIETIIEKEDIPLEVKITRNKKKFS